MGISSSSSKAECSLTGALIYRRLNLKRLYAFILFFLTLFVLILISLKIGAHSLAFKEILTALIGEGPYVEIVRELRLGRTAGAILVGASLGISGALLQNILRNPLASPFTLGISQGAVFGASFAIIVLGYGLTHTAGPQGFTIFNYSVVAFFAFLGAMLVSLLILLLSLSANITPQAMILAGVALGSLFHSATMFLQYHGSDIQVSATVYWTFGDLGKLGLKEIKLLTPIVLLAMGVILLFSWRYNALLFGDDVAKTLGVSPRALRILTLIVVSFLTSLPTSFVGIIGFIGLLSPHLGRMLIGLDQRFLLPMSALIGANLLLLSDIIARTILAPKVLPVGIITSLMGAPLFFLLILRKGRL